MGLNISFLSNKSNSSNQICLEKFFLIFIFVSSTCHEIVNLARVDCFWMVGNIHSIETSDYRFISNRIELWRSLKLYKCISVTDSSLFHRLQKTNFSRILETFLLTTVFRLRFVTIETIALSEVEKVTEWRRRPKKICFKCHSSGWLNQVWWPCSGKSRLMRIQYISNRFPFTMHKFNGVFFRIFSIHGFNISCNLLFIWSSTLEWNYTIKDMYAYEQSTLFISDIGKNPWNDHFCKMLTYKVLHASNWCVKHQWKGHSHTMTGHILPLMRFWMNAKINLRQMQSKWWKCTPSTQHNLAQNGFFKNPLQAEAMDFFKRLMFDATEKNRLFHTQIDLVLTKNTEI